MRREFDQLVRDREYENEFETVTFFLDILLRSYWSMILTGSYRVKVEVLFGSAKQAGWRMVSTKYDNI